MQVQLAEALLQLHRGARVEDQGGSCLGPAGFQMDSRLGAGRKIENSGYNYGVQG